MLSFDAAWCYYAYFPNLQQSELNYQRRDLPYQGSDIYRIHLQTREVQQLTFQEFTPNLGAGNWDETNPVNPPSGYNRLGYGILNLGPCPVPGGKVAFVSNRNAYWPTKSFTAPTLQLLVMDEDGENVEHIAPMTIGSALHPTILRDGRLMFSTYESQGLRDRRLWGIWTIYPDGRYWAPMVSAFRSPQAFHFMTQLSNEDTVVVDYYNLNNNGFGAMYRFPVQPPAGMPGFYGAFPADNPPIDQTVSGGFSYPFKMPFTPYGMYSITPFTHGNDNAAPIGEDRSIVHIDSKQMQTDANEPDRASIQGQKSCHEPRRDRPDITNRNGGAVYRGKLRGGTKPYSPARNSPSSLARLHLLPPRRHSVVAAKKKHRPVTDRRLSAGGVPR